MKKLATLSALLLLGFVGVVQADIDNLDFGGDMMTEYYYGENNDLNANAGDTVDFFRMEGHVYLQADLDDNITARISLEFDRAFNQAGLPFNAANSIGFTGSDDLDIFLE